MQWWGSIKNSFTTPAQAFTVHSWGRIEWFAKYPELTPFDFYV